jgi:hypothetical protein
MVVGLKWKVDMVDVEKFVRDEEDFGKSDWKVAEAPTLGPSP